MDTPNRVVRAGAVEIANDRPFALIAGPCQIESEAHAMEIAGALVEITSALGIGLIYKSSYDKANRTSASAARGIGMAKGLEILARIRERFGCPVLTDVHGAEQCAPAAQAVDVLQIPAFLCRQTDLLLAAGATGKAVNVKKGQWMHPEGMRGATDKVRAAQRQVTSAPAAGYSVAVTERGSFFGYGDLVVDMRAIRRMQIATDAPVVFDATHSVQQPGGQGTSSGGQREFAPVLARAALAVGCAAVFIETHQDPDNAPSDGPNMIPLDQMPALLKRLKTFDDLAKAAS